MSEKKLGFGDRVVHAARPEWGVGTVTTVRPQTVNGKACQQVSVRFERAGLKKLSTAHADLRPADEAESPAPEPEEEAEEGWLAQLEKGGREERMTRLPDEVKDPFKGLEERVRETIALYRFSDEGASLLDWAATQTGLRDPLSRYSRQELEEHFARYARVRDAHLNELLQELSKKDRAAAEAVIRSAPVKVRDAVRRRNAQR